MYQATIYRIWRPDVVLGPTDSRDEASRLARTWIEAQASRIRVQSQTSQSEEGAITGVQIERVEGAR